MALERDGQGDELGDVLGGADGARRVHLVRLRREQRLVGGHADGDFFDLFAAQVGAWAVQEDGASVERFRVTFCRIR